MSANKRRHDETDIRIGIRVAGIGGTLDSVAAGQCGGDAAGKDGGGMKREQYYRHDNVERGNVTLTVESKEGGVIERKTGKVSEMYKYRQLHYPNAYNYRHHF